MPFDIGTGPPGDRQHAFVQVEPYDTSRFSYPIRGGARHYSRAAGDVDDSLTRTEIRRPDDVLRPFPEKRWDEFFLVDLGCFRRNLESLDRIVHLCTSMIGCLLPMSVRERRCHRIGKMPYFEAHVSLVDRNSG